VVNATLDGASWSGDVSYTITGPKSDTGSTVSHSFGDLPAGAYTLGYSSGGPSGATLAGIEPSSTLTLSSGGTVTFTLNFNTQPADAIVVGATLDGSPWSGEVTYTLHGTQDYTGTSVSQTFSNLSDGTYTLSYKAGGPSGATLSSITPKPTKTLSSGGTATFTLNFHSEATGAIVVYATLDGISWSGAVSYSIHGPTLYSGAAVSQNFSGLPAGSYTVTYKYGGPTGATLSSITPQPTQTLSAGGTIEFNLNFHSQTTGTINVGATLNGPSWSGDISYTLHGPYTDYHSSVPHAFGSLPAGTYTLVYSSGGPPGSLLSGISPSATQTLSVGGTLTFTLSFYTPPPPPAVGTIQVNATLDGVSWQTAVGSQPISYTIHGQKSDSGTEVPATFSGFPGGAYTLSYTSGGPAGAVLSSITPAPSQFLSTGHTIVFTMNFHSQAAGTVMVNATLDGEEWEGDVEYYVHGPYMDTSASVPDSFSGCPAGTYTVTYKSGGPPQSVLDSISPSPTQELASGDTITFTLNFIFAGGVLPPSPSST